MLTEIVDYLRSSQALSAELAEAPWGGAAVYTVWAPEHAKPYITLTLDESQDENRQMASGDLIVDAWADGASHVALEPVRDVLHTLLHGEIIDTSRGPVRFIWSSDGPERDDEPQLVRWRMVYAMRRSKTEHAK